ncbi:7124_t:CDS:1 [Dentiscutata heterogama]|uniref:7124_t:CDS:1 n=1 Tax=Dentiscutata heterogama TaxID=1316150 RepID=A0ACA9KW00_9GLOM|nr:7124_t:CDS:1 [Dentiscutata heterogama]
MEPEGKSWDDSRLKAAINEYNKRKYSSAFSTFKSLASYDYSDSFDKSEIKIYSLSTFYLALCYIHGNGVKQDKPKALSITDHLYNKGKYNDAWNIYRELTEGDEMKLTALVKMTNCYQINEHDPKEDNFFKVALELYNKKKYKEAFNIFSKFTSSRNSEIRFLATCFKAFYHISGYNNIKRNKNNALNIISTLN